MSTEKVTQTESLEAWLQTKPYWEQFVWKINLEKDSLSDTDIDQCYQFLCERLGLIDPLPDLKPAISFQHDVIATPEILNGSNKGRLVEVKNFKDVQSLTIAR